MADLSRQREIKRETERERQRETERDRERERIRQTDKTGSHRNKRLLFLPSDFTSLPVIGLTVSRRDICSLFTYGSR